MTRKIALITGASRGLGRSTALHLAAQGVDLIGTYVRNVDAADEVSRLAAARGVRMVMLPFDAADPATIPSFVGRVGETLRQTFGRDHIDFLVNNAGVSLHVPFADTTPAQFDEVMNVHLKTPFFLTQALLPWLADEGRIVNVTSGLARFSMPGTSAYGAMKGAVEVLTRYQAKELGARGIRVNAVAPGAIETDFSDGMVRDNPEVNRFVAVNTGLGRAGQPDDVGGAIAALLADGTGWINGQRIEVSGGMFL